MAGSGFGARPGEPPCIRPPAVPPLAPALTHPHPPPHCTPPRPRSPKGTFSTIPGAACQACPAGHFRAEGGGDGTRCTKCPPGTIPNADKSDCDECPAGTFTSEEGESVCRVW